jgi:hypothetical protein
MTSESTRVGARKMRPVIQLDRTGCAIASVAALTHETYATVKNEAAKLGIVVADPRLWTEMEPMKRLLARFRVSNGGRAEFTSWASLPDRALLAIKWHREKNGPAWHWVVFVRDEAGESVLDSKRALASHRRTDFGRMKPKWFMPVGAESRRRSRPGRITSA